MRTTSSFSRWYFRQDPYASALSHFSTEIIVYDGDELSPEWCEDICGTF